MRQQCAPAARKADSPLGCSNRGVAAGRGEGGGCAPLLCPWKAPPAVLCPGLGPPGQEGCGAAGAGPEEGRGDDQRDGAPLMKTDQELGSFSLAWRRLWEDLSVAYQYFKGAYRQEGERLFTWSDSDRTRGNSFKLKWEI